MRDFEKIRHAFDEGKKVVETVETDTAILAKSKELTKINEELEKKRQQSVHIGEEIVANAQKEAQGILDRVSSIETDMRETKSNLDEQMTKVSKELEKLKSEQSKTAEKGRELDNLRNDIERIRQEAIQKGVDIVAEADKKARVILEDAKAQKIKNEKLQIEMNEQLELARKATKQAKTLQNRMSQNQVELQVSLTNTVENEQESARIKHSIQAQQSDMQTRLEYLSAILLFVAQTVDPIMQTVEKGQERLAQANEEIKEAGLLLLAEKQRLEAKEQYLQDRDIQLDEKSAIIKEQRTQLEAAIAEIHGK